MYSCTKHGSPVLPAERSADCPELLLAPETCSGAAWQDHCTIRLSPQAGQLIERKQTRVLHTQEFLSLLSSNRLLLNELCLTQPLPSVARPAA